MPTTQAIQEKTGGAARARLIFDSTAVPHIPNIYYKPGYYVIYNGKSDAAEPEMTYIYPSATTLMDINMNRIESDNLLNVLDYSRIVKLVLEQ